MEVYEEQYDPNQEFRIFGIGDKTKGGVQSLQEKMNLADDAGSGSSSDDEQQNEQASSQANMTAAKLMPPNPQSDPAEASRFSSASSAHATRGLLADRQSTPQGSIKSSEHQKNALPEDDEFVNDDE